MAPSSLISAPIRGGCPGLAPHRGGGVGRGDRSTARRRRYLPDLVAQVRQEGVGVVGGTDVVERLGERARPGTALATAPDVAPSAASSRRTSALALSTPHSPFQM